MLAGVNVSKYNERIMLTADSHPDIKSHATRIDPNIKRTLHSRLISSPGISDRTCSDFYDCPALPYCFNAHLSHF